MIRVRDDDVLTPSKEFIKKPGGPAGRFRGIHKLIIQNTEKFIHVPTIVVDDIQAFPEVVEYIRDETEAGRMLPEIHGLEHIDYGARDDETVTDHLKQCKEFLHHEFGVYATKWYTPWGADSPVLRELASELDLELVGVKDRIEPSEVVNAFKHNPTKAREKYSDCEIMIHWWEGGANKLDFLTKEF